jgi:hypothetical protein
MVTGGNRFVRNSKPPYSAVSFLYTIFLAEFFFMDDLQKSLSAIIPQERIKSRLIDLVSYASDAGFYHLIPKVVVQPASVEEVRQLFGVCRELKVPLTFVPEAAVFRARLLQMAYLQI